MGRGRGDGSVDILLTLHCLVVLLQHRLHLLSVLVAECLSLFLFSSPLLLHLLGDALLVCVGGAGLPVQRVAVQFSFIRCALCECIVLQSVFRETCLRLSLAPSAPPQCTALSSGCPSAPQATCGGVSGGCGWCRRRDSVVDASTPWACGQMKRRERI